LAAPVANCSNGRTIPLDIVNVLPTDAPDDIAMPPEKLPVVAVRPDVITRLAPISTPLENAPVVPLKPDDATMPPVNVAVLAAIPLVKDIEDPVMPFVNTPLDAAMPFVNEPLEPTIPLVAVIVPVEVIGPEVNVFRLASAPPDEIMAVPPISKRPPDTMSISPPDCTRMRPLEATFV
jgi:hypothetical protein